MFLVMILDLLRSLANSYFLNVKFALWKLLSLSFRTSWPHVFAQALSVFHT